MFDMFVVDLMHEVELGVWRALFIHLMRILQATKPTAIADIDHRYPDSFLLDFYFSSHIHLPIVIGVYQHLGVIRFENLQPIPQR